MHTFNIKNNYEKVANMISNNKNLKESAKTNNSSFKNSISEGGNISKCYYIEENTKLLEKIIRKTYPALKDLIEKIEYFELISQLSIKDRNNFLLESKMEVQHLKKI